MSGSLFTLRRFLRPFSKASGFTLIETAIVLVIAGLILSSGLTWYTLQLKQQRLETSKQRLSDIQYALKIFAATKGRLPCPADPSLPLTSSGWGDESNCAAPPSAVTSVVLPALPPPAPPQVVLIGAVPVNALNLSSAHSMDGWHGRYTYAVSMPLTEPNGMNASPEPPGLISVVDDNGANALAVANTARFVILSAGPSGAGAYNSHGVRKDCPAATVRESENCNGDAKFMTASLYAATGNGFYDDIAMHDLTVNVSGPSDDIDKIKICNAKRMFYNPTSIQPAPDADGCVGGGGMGGLCAEHSFAVSSGPGMQNLLGRNIAGLLSLPRNTDASPLGPIPPIPPAIMVPGAGGYLKCACPSGYTKTPVALLSARDDGMNLYLDMLYTCVPQ